MAQSISIRTQHCQSVYSIYIGPRHQLKPAAHVIFSKEGVFSKEYCFVTEAKTNH